MAAFLSELPFGYRYSLRGIPVGPRTAVNQLAIYRRNWFQKRLGLRGVISEHFGSGTGAAFQNQHALRMAADADDAITEAESGAVRFCYVTPKVVITEDTAAAADEHAQLVFKFCQNMGFDPRIETINAAEAWLGSLPGQGWYDVRRPLVNTQNLADILPLTSIWPGLATNPCPYYPPETPALCYGATSGSTPVITYLFHRIDQRLDGRPTLIILDEAWIMLAQSLFGAKIEEWLRTLRKKNAAVVLATQRLSEIANSPHRNVILESCPTRIYLPNPEATNAASRELSSGTILSLLPGLAKFAPNISRRAGRSSSKAVCVPASTSRKMARQAQTH